MFTHEQLLELLTYDPISGDFVSNLSNKRIGTVSPEGYTKIKIKGRKYRAARVAFFYMTGKWPYPTVDHRNRVRNDDRWENLREASYHEQCYNRTLPVRTLPDGNIGSSLLTHGDGVYKRKDRTNCWRARTWIIVDGKSVRVSIGQFATEQEAINAYVAYRTKTYP